MALVIKNWNGLLVVTSSVNTNYIANRFIWLQEITVFSNSTLVEEGFRCLCLGAIVINNQR